MSKWRYNFSSAVDMFDAIEHQWVGDDMEQRPRTEFRTECGEENWCEITTTYGQRDRDFFNAIFLMNVDATITRQSDVSAGGVGEK